MINFRWWSEEELIAHPDDSGTWKELGSRDYTGLQGRVEELELECSNFEETIEGIEYATDAAVEQVEGKHETELDEIQERVDDLTDKIDKFLGGDGVNIKERRRLGEIKTLAEMIML